MGVVNQNDGALAKPYGQAHSWYSTVLQIKIAVHFEFGTKFIVFVQHRVWWSLEH